MDLIQYILDHPLKAKRAAELIAEKYVVNPSTQCWEWQRALNGAGYGKLRMMKHGDMKAHRLSWALANQVSPSDMCVCHKCDNPKCVNPDHLFLGTRADNHLDMMKKGRHSNPPTHRGESHPNAYMSDETVREIYLAQGSPKEIMERFGLKHYNTLRRIKLKLTRKEALANV